MVENEKNAQEKQAAAAPAGGDQNKQPTATEQAFENYKLELIKTDIPNGHSVMKSGFIEDRSKRAVRIENLGALNKTKETLTFYQTLSDHITTLAKQEATDIHANVLDYKAKNAALAAKLSDALRACNTAKEKIQLAKASAFKMEENLKNSAYSDAVAELDKVFGPAKGDFGKAVISVKNNAEACLNLADDTVEVAVKVSGIQAGANVETLEGLSTQLKEKTSGIHQDVSNNAAGARSAQAAAQTNYDKILAEIVAFKYKKYEKSMDHGATYDTISQVHEQDCKGWQPWKYKSQLENIAKNIERNFIETTLG